MCSFLPPLFAIVTNSWFTFLPLFSKYPPLFSMQQLTSFCYPILILYSNPNFNTICYLLTFMLLLLAPPSNSYATHYKSKCTSTSHVIKSNLLYQLSYSPPKIPNILWNEATKCPMVISVEQNVNSPLSR